MGVLGEWERRYLKKNTKSRNLNIVLMELSENASTSASMVASSAIPLQTLKQLLEYSMKNEGVINTEPVF